MSRRTSKPTRVRSTMRPAYASGNGAATTSRSCGRTSWPASVVTGTEEAHHELRSRRVVELVRAADLLDGTVVDHHDLVGDLEGLFLVMGDEHGGDVHLVVQPAQPGPQLLADLGVQGPERLVQQQHGRLDRQRPGQRHPLSLTAGQLRRHPIGELGQVNQRQQLVDLGRDLLLRPLPDLEAESDVLRPRSCAGRPHSAGTRSRRSASGPAAESRRCPRSRRSRCRTARVRR